MSAALHPACLSWDELRARCQETRTRRSGPGGQHRNKVETAIVLLDQVTGISAEAGERRSQAENRKVAVFRLRLNLALQVRTELPETNDLSELWKSRCRNGRISVSSTHDDFPAILAEALDAILVADWDVSLASERLSATTSQLIKLLKQEPRALGLVNAERRQRGLRAYR